MSKVGASTLSEATADPWSAWQQVEPARLLTGFAYGYSYPSIVVKARLPATTADERQAMAQAVRAVLPERAQPALDTVDSAGTDATIGTSARWLAALASGLTTAAGLPVVEPARVLRARPDLSIIAAPVVLRGLAPLAGLFQLVLNELALPLAGRAQLDVIERAQELFHQLVAANLTTSNTPRLVKAAVENGIAYQELPGTSVVQYGLGRRAVLLDSTFTPFTPNIGARFARNKHEAAAMLRRNRIPVPDHVLVYDEAQALAAAAKLGYPLVIKPADKDGGLAVWADLRTEAELRQAFAVARAVSQKVLVERFVEGRDYRITVFRGRAIWAIERLAACVTGDGVLSIAQLVDQANSDPRRGVGAHALLKNLKLDDEALGLLTREGQTADTVPAAGQVIRLRRAANVASGGIPVARYDEMHADNARLAVRAAQALKLDMAGIDLLIPDIAVSWKETGGFICEVNGQPELGAVTSMHLYPIVLRDLLSGDGHVPTVALVGGDRAERLGTAIAGVILRAGLIAGLHSRAGIRIGNTQVEVGRVPQIDAGRMLAGHAAVDALVLAAANAGLVHYGFPVPRIDLLVITGERLEQPFADSDEPPTTPAQLLQALAPHCRQVAVLDPPGPAQDRWIEALTALQITYDTLSPDAVAARVSALVRTTHQPIT